MKSGTVPARAAGDAVMRRGAWAGTAAGMAMLAWWALGPLSERPAIAPVETATEGTVSEGPAALDVGAFQTLLWPAPAPAPPAPAPAPGPVKVEPAPPPPLRLQILAVSRGDEGGADGGAALLYDPDADKAVWVRAGSRVGVRTIERVLARGVEIREGAVVRALALEDARPAASAVERALAGARSGGSGR